MATLLLIRHAIAETREEWNELGRTDADRPLTPKGIERFTQAVQGLQRLFPAVDRILTSPYARTRETAKLLLAAYPDTRIEQSEHLAPDGSFATIAERLRNFDEKVWVAIVGHEPALSRLLAYLVRAETRGRKSRNPLPTFTELKKGGVAQIELPPKGEPGSGTLRLLVSPRILRELGQQPEDG